MSGAIGEYVCRTCKRQTDNGWPWCSIKCAGQSRPSTGLGKTPEEKRAFSAAWDSRVSA